MKKYVLPFLFGLAVMASTGPRAQTYGILIANNFECSVT